MKRPSQTGSNTSIYSILILAIVLAMQSACGTDEQAATGAASESQRVFDFPFADGEAGSQYLFFPYITGNDSIEGKDEKIAASVEIQASGATVKIDPTYGLSMALRMQTTSTPSAFADALRHFLNRSNPRAPDFESKLQDLLQSAANLTLSQQKQLRQDARRFLQPKTRFLPQKQAALTQSLQSCPETILLPNDNQDEVTTDEQINYFDESNYCLVFVGETSRDEPNNVTIKASIAEALSRYQSIFDDSFNQSLEDSNYAFKPLIIVVDSSSTSDIWPSAFASIAGAYVSALTEDHDRPTIYMASDLSNVGIDQNRRAFFHSTLGHELFHAIFDHYRVQIGGGSPSIPVIDEGLAHFFEDLMGYGELNFDQYAGNFLNNWRAGMAVSALSIFDNATISSATSEASTIRGAGHTLIYYLVSQAGGIEFTNGKASGGGGLSFLRSLVQGNERGPWSLGAALDSNWPEVFGQYLTALAADNTSFSNARSSVQAPVSGVVDLQGGSGKTYGMRFNNFAELPSADELLGEDYYDTADPEALKGIDLHYYQSLPMLVTIEGASSSLTFVFETNNKNAGVSYIEL